MKRSSQIITVFLLLSLSGYSNDRKIQTNFFYKNNAVKAHIPFLWAIINCDQSKDCSISTIHKYGGDGERLDVSTNVSWPSILRIENPRKTEGPNHLLVYRNEIVGKVFIDSSGRFESIYLDPYYFKYIENNNFLYFLEDNTRAKFVTTTKINWIGNSNFTVEPLHAKLLCDINGYIFNCVVLKLFLGSEDDWWIFKDDNVQIDNFSLSCFNFRIESGFQKHHYIFAWNNSEKVNLGYIDNNYGAAFLSDIIYLDPKKFNFLKVDYLNDVPTLKTWTDIFCP